MSPEQNGWTPEDEAETSSSWAPSSPKRLRKVRLTPRKTDAELDAMEAHMTALCGAKKDAPKARKIQLAQEED